MKGDDQGNQPLLDYIIESVSYGDSGANAPDGYEYYETATKDAKNQTTKSLRDLFGRVRRVIPPAGPDVSYSYDAADRLVSTARVGSTTTITYDLGGRKIKLIDPDLGDRRYVYHAAGNLVRYADARGKRLCLYYDAENYLTDVSGVNSGIKSHENRGIKCPLQFFLVALLLPLIF